MCIRDRNIRLQFRIMVDPFYQQLTKGRFHLPDRQFPVISSHDQLANHGIIEGRYKIVLIDSRFKPNIGSAGNM